MAWIRWMLKLFSCRSKGMEMCGFSFMSKLYWYYLCGHDSRNTSIKSKKGNHSIFYIFIFIIIVIVMNISTLLLPLSFVFHNAIIFFFLAQNGFFCSRDSRQKPWLLTQAPWRVGVTGRTLLVASIYFCFLLRFKAYRYAPRANQSAHLRWTNCTLLLRAYY